MFPWARATVFARRNQCDLIWPVWPQFHLGSWLRWERDKRTYAGLFRRPREWTPNWTVWRPKTFLEGQERAFLSHEGSACLTFSGLGRLHADLLGERDLLWQELCRSSRADLARLRDRGRGKIGICIRLGDYQKLGWSTPVDWFVERLQELRRHDPCRQIWLFSDGSDAELAPILRDRLVSRPDLGATALDALALMSGLDLLIATGGSTLYRWAGYFGGAPAITHAFDDFHRDAWRGFSRHAIGLVGREAPTVAHWRGLLGAVDGR